MLGRLPGLSDLAPWLTILGVYHLVAAVMLWKTAKRLREEPAWFAVAPFLNALLFLKLARKPSWWFLLFFVPLANLAVLVAAMMSLCERLGYDKRWGFVVILSPFNLILLLRLALDTAPPAAAPEAFPGVPPETSPVDAPRT